MGRFRWIDINWPGATSDYMAWVTSEFCNSLEEELGTIFAKGMTLSGDNAYVKRLYMAIPLRGTRGGYEDAYNFYWCTCPSVGNFTCPSHNSTAQGAGTC